MLAQQLFFTFLFSMLVNNSFLYCMEKKIKVRNFDDKILRYVAKEKIKMPPYPIDRIVQRKPLTEIDDEIQQKVVSKVLKQNQIMHLAAKEIGLETPKMPTNNHATIIFENTTKFVLYIQDTRLDPKKSIILEMALLKLSNRLSYFEIPVYAADTTQIVAGFGPVVKYEKSNQRLATLKGIRSQMISEVPDYEFYSKFNVLDPNLEKESNSFENSNLYHTYIILSGKTRSDGTLALDAFLGSGASQYDAAKHAQEQKDIASRPPARQPKEITAYSVTQSRESIRPSPSIANMQDIPYDEQSIAMMKDNDETSMISVKAKNPAKKNETTTRINSTFSATPPQRPQGGIGVSQSTTHVKPAFPPAKNESEQKAGSLIYGSLRRAREALGRTVSLTDVKGAVKKEPKQPQEMKGNA